MDGDFDLELEVKVIQKDIDGQVFVRLASDGALLKVMPPQGRGKRANEKQALDKLHARAVNNFDEALVKETVKAARAEWVCVGSFVSSGQPGCPRRTGAGAWARKPVSFSRRPNPAAATFLRM
ncbi:hypothetical protein MASR2M48_25870 [Spirochaetota bacterium]